MALSELPRAQVTKRLTATAQRSSSLVASLGILLTVLLSGAANAPGALAKEKDQWAERLTFATGRSVAYLSSAPLREPQPQVQIAIIVVHGLDRDDESNFARITAAAQASGKGPVSPSSRPPMTSRAPTSMSGRTTAALRAICRKTRRTRRDV